MTGGGEGKQKHKQILEQRGGKKEKSWDGPGTFACRRIENLDPLELFLRGRLSSVVHEGAVPESFDENLQDRIQVRHEQNERECYDSGDNRSDCKVPSVDVGENEREYQCEQDDEYYGEDDSCVDEEKCEIELPGDVHIHEGHLDRFVYRLKNTFSIEYYEEFRIHEQHIDDYRKNEIDGKEDGYLTQVFGSKDSDRQEVEGQYRQESEESHEIMELEEWQEAKEPLRDSVGDCVLLLILFPECIDQTNDSSLRNRAKEHVENESYRKGDDYLHKVSLVCEIDHERKEFALLLEEDDVGVRNLVDDNDTQVEC